MTGAVLALVLAATSVDPCAPVASGDLDPATAAEYRAVGDSERAAGRRDPAAAAYRGALARNPEDAQARGALAALCAEARSASAFERGVQKMDAGDRVGAIAAFEEARAAGAGPSAALLEGICRYELGDDARARPLLLEAEADAQNRESARFFLGLVALRAGRSRDAATLLEQSALDRHLGPLALGLARDARRDGKVVFSVLFEGGFDSNVDLTPDGLRGTADEGDAAIGGTAVVRATPFGEAGPYARLTGTFRDQAQYAPLDLRGGGVAAGWQAGRGGRYLVAEYEYDYRDMASAPYLSAHRVLGAARVALGRTGASVGATGFARREDFLASGDEGFSGFRVAGEGDLTLELAPHTALTLAWHGARDLADDATQAWVETGPRAALRVPLGPDARLGFEVSGARRDYDTGGATTREGVRSDTLLDVSALAEFELSTRWTLRASLLGRKAWSNFPEFRYSKLVPTLGLVYTVGLL